MTTNDMSGFEKHKAAMLSRRIPARTETIRFLWIQKGFSSFTQQWRDIRAKCRTPEDTCFWCKKKFDDGESIALAAIPKSRNRVMCETCADQALEARADEIYRDE